MAGFRVLCDGSAMHCCPRDKVGLVAHVIRGSSVSHCRACSGIWLSPALVTKAVGHLPHVRASEATHSSGIICPSDGNVMVAVRHRGVEIDVCAGCGGVWLDRGELERILQRGPASSARLDLSGVDGFDAARLALEIGGELGTQLLTNDNFLSSAGEMAGGAVDVVLEFIGAALSGF